MGRHKKPQNVIMEGENKTQIVNDNRDLAVIPGELVPREADREDLFVRNLFIYKDTYSAAIKAGYSPTYAKSSISRKFSSPRFQSKIRDLAASMNYAFLPKVLNIHRLGLEAIEKDLENGGHEKASKLKHITRQTLLMGGLLHDDPVSTVSYVNIRNLQAVIQTKMGLLPSDDDG